MKINELFEGYYKTLDIERQEGRYRVPKPLPKNPEPENTNQLYHIELWYDTTGYLVTTVAPTIKKAQAIALYRVKKYLKAHYPRYDVTGLRKDQVQMDIVPQEQLKDKKSKLVVI